MTETIFLTTKSGKKLEYRAMNPGEVLDLILACGNEATNNEMYLNVVQSWCGVRSVDGIPVPFPRDKKSIHELANVIGNDGIEEISKYLSKADENSEFSDVDVIKN